MNQRIKQLLKQAQESYTYTDADGDNNRGVRLNEQKFAELIVKECGEFCGHDHEGVVAMFKHFGVEE
jgi:hypothetical protein